VSVAALPGAALPGAAQIVSALGAWQAGHGASVVVAIDGHGGSGKTTIAGQAAAQLGVALVHTDDYFRDAGAGGSDRRPMARYYDWERMRAQAILPALARGQAAPILIEGVSSASPALADLVTHAVLVVAPEPVRLARLHQRVSDEEWDEEWLAEERRYFGQRPAASFDLVVAGSVV
jgi:uridine kinase